MFHETEERYKIWRGIELSLIKKLTNINRCLTNPANRCITDVQPILTDTISHTLHIQS